MDLQQAQRRGSWDRLHCWRKMKEGEQHLAEAKRVRQQVEG